MQRYTNQTGRTSCWVIGGLGCLGLLVLLVIGMYLLGRAFQQTFGGVIQMATEIEQVFEPRFQKVTTAIQRYLQDNNGKYPPNLQALVPKYLQAEDLQPIELSDGTKIEFVYKAPKPNDPPSTVVLEHNPPVSIPIEMMGEKVDTRITYQFTKDGRIEQRQEQVTSSGQRRTRTRPVQ